MVYNSQKGSGFHGDLFGTLTRTFKPIAEGVADVGANLATGLVSDLLSGKGPKTSIKERGNQAKGLVAQRALEKLQGGSGTKRKRSRSKIQPTELVTAISEIVLNLIKGVIKLTASQKKRLSRYKKDLLALAKKKLSIGKKRKILVQKGGSAAVSILVPLALSLLSSKLK